MDLVQWRKHIDQVVADEGQWLGVADENGYPIYELLGTVNFPESHLQAASAEATVNVQPGDRVLDDLVGEQLGEVDDAGRLVPANGATRLLLLIRPGERRAATITHTVVTGQAVPSQVTIHGVDLLDGLAAWPCPSIPLEGWEMAEWEQWSTDASGAEYASARDLALLQLATKLDGYAKRGRAKSLVREIIQDSLDAVNALYGWVDDPHMVVEFPGDVDTSGESALRVSDDDVWSTVSETARAAGLSVDVSLWWPGDDPVSVRVDQQATQLEGRSWNHPIQVVRVREIGEVA